MDEYVLLIELKLFDTTSTTSQQEIFYTDVVAFGTQSFVVKLRILSRSELGTSAESYSQVTPFNLSGSQPIIFLQIQGADNELKAKIEVQAFQIVVSRLEKILDLAFSSSLSTGFDAISSFIEVAISKPVLNDDEPGQEYASISQRIRSYLVDKHILYRQNVVMYLTSRYQQLASNVQNNDLYSFWLDLCLAAGACEQQRRPILVSKPEITTGFDNCLANPPLFQSLVSQPLKFLQDVEAITNQLDMRLDLDLKAKETEFVTFFGELTSNDLPRTIDDLPRYQDASSLPLNHRLFNALLAIHHLQPSTLQNVVETLDSVVKGLVPDYNNLSSQEALRKQYQLLQCSKRIVDYCGAGIYSILKSSVATKINEIEPTSYQAVMQSKNALDSSSGDEIESRLNVLQTTIRFIAVNLFLTEMGMPHIYFDSEEWVTSEAVIIGQVLKFITDKVNTDNSEDFEPLVKLIDKFSTFPSPPQNSPLGFKLVAVSQAFNIASPVLIYAFGKLSVPIATFDHFKSYLESSDEEFSNLVEMLGSSDWSSDLKEIPLQLLDFIGKYRFDAEFAREFIAYCWTLVAKSWLKASEGHSNPTSIESIRLQDVEFFVEGAKAFLDPPLNLLMQDSNDTAISLATLYNTILSKIQNFFSSIWTMAESACENCKTDLHKDGELFVESEDEHHEWPLLTSIQGESLRSCLLKFQDYNLVIAPSLGPDTQMLHHFERWLRAALQCGVDIQQELRSWKNLLSNSKKVQGGFSLLQPLQDLLDFKVDEPNFSNTDWQKYRAQMADSIQLLWFRDVFDTTDKSAKNKFKSDNQGSLPPPLFKKLVDRAHLTVIETIQLSEQQFMAKEALNQFFELVHSIYSASGDSPIFFEFYLTREVISALSILLEALGAKLKRDFVPLDSQFEDQRSNLFSICFLIGCLSTHPSRSSLNQDESIPVHAGNELISLQNLLDLYKSVNTNFFETACKQFESEPLDDMTIVYKAVWDQFRHSENPLSDLSTDINQTLATSKLECIQNFLKLFNECEPAPRTWPLIYLLHHPKFGKFIIQWRGSRNKSVLNEESIRMFICRMDGIDPKSREYFEAILTGQQLVGLFSDTGAKRMHKLQLKGVNQVLAQTDPHIPPIDALKHLAEKIPERNIDGFFDEIRKVIIDQDVTVMEKELQDSGKTSQFFLSPQSDEYQYRIGAKNSNIWRSASMIRLKLNGARGKLGEIIQLHEEVINIMNDLKHQNAYGFGLSVELQQQGSDHAAAVRLEAQTDARELKELIQLLKQIQTCWNSERIYISHLRSSGSSSAYWNTINMRDLPMLELGIRNPGSEILQRFSEVFYDVREISFNNEATSCHVPNRFVQFYFEKKRAGKTPKAAREDLKTQIEKWFKAKRVAADEFLKTYTQRPLSVPARILDDHFGNVQQLSHIQWMTVTSVIGRSTSTQNNMPTHEYYNELITGCDRVAAVLSCMAHSRAHTFVEPKRFSHEKDAKESQTLAIVPPASHILDCRQHNFDEETISSFLSLACHSDVRIPYIVLFPDCLSPKQKSMFVSAISHLSGQLVKRKHNSALAPLMFVTLFGDRPTPAFKGLADAFASNLKLKPTQMSLNPDALNDFIQHKSSGKSQSGAQFRVHLKGPFNDADNAFAVSGKSTSTMFRHEGKLQPPVHLYKFNGLDDLIKNLASRANIPTVLEVSGESQSLADEVFMHHLLFHQVSAPVTRRRWLLFGANNLEVEIHARGTTKHVPLLKRMHDHQVVVEEPSEEFIELLAPHTQLLHDLYKAQKSIPAEDQTMQNRDWLGRWFKIYSHLTNNQISTVVQNFNLSERHMFCRFWYWLLQDAPDYVTTDEYKASGDFDWQRLDSFTKTYFLSKKGNISTKDFDAWLRGNNVQGLQHGFKWFIPSPAKLKALRGGDETCFPPLIEISAIAEYSASALEACAPAKMIRESHFAQKMLAALDPDFNPPIPQEDYNPDDFPETREEDSPLISPTSCDTTVANLLFILTKMFSSERLQDLHEAYPQFIASPFVCIRLIIACTHIILRLPFVMESETGQGKTLLVRILEFLMRPYFVENDQSLLHMMDLNPGVEFSSLKKQLKKFIGARDDIGMNRTVDVNEFDDNDTRLSVAPTCMTPLKRIVFIDEINASSLSEFLRSFICDRRLDRHRVSNQIALLGACNPATDSESVDGTQSHAAYSVEPLPASLECFKFDLDTAALEDVQFIVSALTYRWCRLAKNKDDGSLEDSRQKEHNEYYQLKADAAELDADTMSRIFTEEAHQWLKFALRTAIDLYVETIDKISQNNRFNTRQAVPSLRTLNRLFIFAGYFRRFIEVCRRDAQKISLSARKRPIFARFAEVENARIDSDIKDMVSSLLLAATMVFCWTTPEPSISKNVATPIPGNRVDIIKYMDDVATNFVDAAEIHLINPAIVRTTSLDRLLLAEFVHYVAVQPLFVVGDPGSSKSLSATIFANLMKPSAVGNDRRFDHLRSSVMQPKKFAFTKLQCGKNVTAAMLEGAFETARKAVFSHIHSQKTLLMIEEAEFVDSASDSEKMNILVPSGHAIHKILDANSEYNAATGMVIPCILFANQYLDAAKMNRGTVIFKGALSPEELYSMTKTSLQRGLPIPNLKADPEKGLSCPRAINALTEFTTSILLLSLNPRKSDFHLDMMCDPRDCYNVLHDIQAYRKVVDQEASELSGTPRFLTHLTKSLCTHFASAKHLSSLLSDGFRTLLPVLKSISCARADEVDANELIAMSSAAYRMELILLRLHTNSVDTSAGQTSIAMCDRQMLVYSPILPTAFNMILFENDSIFKRRLGQEYAFDLSLVDPELPETNDFEYRASVEAISAHYMKDIKAALSERGEGGAASKRALYCPISVYMKLLGVLNSHSPNATLGIRLPSIPVEGRWKVFPMMANSKLVLVENNIEVLKQYPQPILSRLVKMYLDSNTLLDRAVHLFLVAAGATEQASLIKSKLDDFCTRCSEYLRQNNLDVVMLKISIMLECLMSKVPSRDMLEGDETAAEALVRIVMESHQENFFSSSYKPSFPEYMFEAEKELLTTTKSGEMTPLLVLNHYGPARFLTAESAQPRLKELASSFRDAERSQIVWRHSSNHEEWVGAIRGQISKPVVAGISLSSTQLLSRDELSRMLEALNKRTNATYLVFEIDVVTINQVQISEILTHLAIQSFYGSTNVRICVMLSKPLDYQEQTSVFATPFCRYQNVKFVSDFEGSKLKIDKESSGLTIRAKLSKKTMQHSDIVNEMPSLLELVSCTTAPERYVVPKEALSIRMYETLNQEPAIEVTALGSQSNILQLRPRAESEADVQRVEFFVRAVPFSLVGRLLDHIEEWFRANNTFFEAETLSLDDAETLANLRLTFPQPPSPNVVSFIQSLMPRHPGRKVRLPHGTSTNIRDIAEIADRYELHYGPFRSLEELCLKQHAAFIEMKHDSEGESVTILAISQEKYDGCYEFLTLLGDSLRHDQDIQLKILYDGEDSSLKPQVVHTSEESVQNVIPAPHHSRQRVSSVMAVDMDSDDEEDSAT